MSYNKTFVCFFFLVFFFWGVVGDMKNEKEIKDENEVSFFMSKVCNNSSPNMILGVCWGVHMIAHHSSPSLQWHRFQYSTEST